MALVLIVDDDHNVGDLLRQFLEGEGYEVRLAAKAGLGIKLVRECRPDVALVDLMMPDDGATFSEQLQALYNGGVPVIMMSASGAMGEHEARRLGAEYLAKPFDLDHVQKLIQKCLGVTDLRR